jgi:hypothetical protein
MSFICFRPVPVEICSRSNTAISEPETGFRRPDAAVLWRLGRIVSAISTSMASSFETHRFAMLLRIFFLVEVPDPHGEERGFARLEP